MSCSSGESDVSSRLRDSLRDVTNKMADLSENGNGTNPKVSGLETHDKQTKKNKVRTKDRLIALEEKLDRIANAVVDKRPLISPDFETAVKRSHSQSQRLQEYDHDLPASQVKRVKFLSERKSQRLVSSESSEDDIISLQPGQSERLTDSSESDPPPVLVREDNVGVIENKADLDKTKTLLDIFGSDALNKKEERSNGIHLDDAQSKVLKDSWRSKAPNLLTAFSENCLDNFPLSEDTKSFIQVPPLDDIVESCLIQKYGHKASFSKSGKCLFGQPYKMLEKIAYRGQQAAAMGITIQLYVQQALACLMEGLSSGSDSKEESVEKVQNIFAMCTKNLDQFGRVGAFHHIIRRTVAMSDTNLYELEVSRLLTNLPLTGDGVFGPGLEEILRSRKDHKKAMNELLPEFRANTIRKRKSSTVTQETYPKRSKFSGNDRFQAYKADSSRVEHQRPYYDRRQNYKSGSSKNTGTKKPNFRPNTYRYNKGSKE